jgi:ATP-dependent Clp protease ATP-binding subunit ClpC
VFERFTQPARQAVLAAQDQARELRHSHVGSEHLLLGLLLEPEGLAARVLASLDVSFDASRLALVRHGASAEGAPPQAQIPFTPRSKQVLERAGDESVSLGHNYVGTEHLLLALAGVDEGVAMRILGDFDLDARKIREAVIRLLSGPPVAPPGAGRGRASVTPLEPS